jgi:stage II sporulation protein E
MYMQMKESVCDQCEGRFRCFHVNPEATYEAAKAVFLTLDEKGALDKEDIPDDFAAVCDHHEAFLIGANQSFERAKANRILEQKLADSRQILADQMGDVARMMSEFGSSLSVDCGRDESVELMLQLKLRLYHVEIRQVLVAKREMEPDVLYVVARCGEGVLMTAKELSGHIGAVYHRPYRPAAGCKAVITRQFEVYSFVEDTAYRVVKGVRRVAMEEKKNGDNYSYLSLEDGRFIAMLSDGMGTGQCAYEQSATLIELLEEFLEAGWSQETALKLANSVMALNIDSTAYATLDFCSLNLYTGVARLIKIGAAATFIKRGGQVEQVISTSLPAGVFAKMDCDAVELKLRDGDLVVMLSDGVVDAVIVEEKEAYIKQVLSELSDVSPQMVAEQLIEKIMETGMSRVKDDMTVLAFLVTKGECKWTKECTSTSKNSIC